MKKSQMLLGFILGLLLIIPYISISVAKPSYVGIEAGSSYGWKRELDEDTFEQFCADAKAAGYEGCDDDYEDIDHTAEKIKVKNFDDDQYVDAMYYEFDLYFSDSQDDSEWEDQGVFNFGVMDPDYYDDGTHAWVIAFAIPYVAAIDIDWDDEVDDLHNKVLSNPGDFFDDWDAWDNNYSSKALSYGLEYTINFVGMKALTTKIEYDEDTGVLDSLEETYDGETLRTYDSMEIKQDLIPGYPILVFLGVVAIGIIGVIVTHLRSRGK